MYFPAKQDGIIFGQVTVLRNPTFSCKPVCLSVRQLLPGYSMGLNEKCSGEFVWVLGVSITI